MQSEKSYEGACVVCKHKWREGVIGKQCCFGGYRTFLPARSRGRQARVPHGGHVYEYGTVETRSPAPFRDVASARRCLAVVEALEMPCGGHKSPPLIARWPGFDWYRMNPPELMHDSKIFLEMLLKVLVGKVSGTGFYGGWSYDNKHRQEAKVLGIFESIWPCNNGLYLGVSPALKENSLTREWESSSGRNTSRNFITLVLRFGQSRTEFGKPDARFVCCILFYQHN